MSNQITKAYNNSNGSSETSYPHQSSWMSRWSQTPSKRGSLLAPHSKTFRIEDGLESLNHKQKRLRRSLNISSDIPKSSGVNHSAFRPGLASDVPLVPNAAENGKRVMVFGRNFSDDNARCSLQNVKTMRICATVDSFGNSDGDCPLFSQTMTHHFIFGKQNGMNLSREHQGVRESRGGVKIQPLWSSTDSEKDNFGDVVTTGADDGRDLSAEADTMDLVAFSKKKHFPGSLLSPPAVKRTAKDKSILSDSIGPPKDNHRSKFPASNIPNINPMDDDDDMEPTSTSRTISMGAEHIISCSKQPFKSNPTPQNKECSLSELSSIWVKRWKLGSSDTGGSSALTASMKSKSTIFQSSWIQRWSDPRKSEASGSKVPVDVVERKQFPSIAAMALMGKSMNGFRTCKFSKRGPLVVWSSEDC